MNLKNRLIFLFFIIILITTCKIFYINKKKSFYICSNIEYNRLFNDYKNIEHVLIKYFKRNFYNVKVRKIASFSGILSEYSNIANSDKNAIIFVNDFLIGGILNSKTTFENNKIITYNNKDINKNKELLSIFNIYVDSNLIAENILNIIKKEKKKSDYSDILLVINNNYTIPKEVKDIIKSKIPKITILEENNESKFKKYLEEEKDKFNTVVIFGYNLNKVLMDIETENREKDSKEKLLNITYIEIFSNYLNSVNLSGYSLNLLWDNIIKIGINSKEFRNFLEEKNIKSYDFKISKNKGIIKIKKKLRYAPSFIFKEKREATSD